jgi:hypothetical protein
MIANPLPPDSRIRAGEDVKAKLEPVAEAVGDFERFVQLVFRGILAVYDCLAPLEGEVAVKLEHRGARRDQLGTVHLNLITALRLEEPERSEARAVSSKVRINVMASATHCPM